MENDNLLTKTCPYCGETIEFDIFKDVVNIGEDSIGTKCSNCHKVIDVTEEFINRFKQLFIQVVQPQRTYIYKTEDEE